jgi:hypothetical protein
MTCLPPPPTVISASEYSMPCVRRSDPRIASRRLGVPLTGVYFVSPAWIAVIAACLTCSGVSTA